MIAWRSREPQLALAAAVCLAGVGLAANISSRAHPKSVTPIIAWGWLVAGLMNAAMALVQYMGLTVEPLGTAFGFLRQRNHLATLCNIALLSLIYLWLEHVRRSHQTKHGCHVLAGLASALLTVALAATCSRTGWLELGVVMTLMLVYAARMRHRYLCLAIAWTWCLYVIAAWALPELSGVTETVLNRLSGTGLIAAAEGGMELRDSRQLLWRHTLTLIQGHPVWGLGWHELAFALRTTDFGSSPRLTEQADNAHNLPLQFAAELGIPFAVLWFAFLMWLILQSQPWRTRTPERWLGWGAMLIMGIHSLLEYPLWYGPFQIAIGLAAGLVFVQHTQTGVAEARRNRARIWQAGAGVVLISFCAYAAWDYHRVRQLFIPEDERSSLYRAHTLAQAEESWLFAEQVRFAKLTTTPITPTNAQSMALLAQQVAHFSPEPLVFDILANAKRVPLK